jgi:hypothetical protein
MWVLTGNVQNVAMTAEHGSVTVPVDFQNLSSTLASPTDRSRDLRIRANWELPLLPARLTRTGWHSSIVEKESTDGALRTAKSFNASRTNACFSPLTRKEKLALRGSKADVQRALNDCNKRAATWSDAWSCNPVLRVRVEPMVAQMMREDIPSTNEPPTRPVW